MRERKIFCLQEQKRRTEKHATRSIGNKGGNGKKTKKQNDGSKACRPNERAVKTRKTIPHLLKIITLRDKRLVKKTVEPIKSITFAPAFMHKTIL